MSDLGWVCLAGWVLAALMCAYGWHWRNEAELQVGETWDEYARSIAAQLRAERAEERLKVQGLEHLGITVQNHHLREKLGAALDRIQLLTDDKALDEIEDEVDRAAAEAIALTRAEVIPIQRKAAD